MREILFRGKRLDTGEWVEGYYVEKKDPLLESDVRNAFILAQGRGDSFVTWFPVDPTTVGQFTGLRDKNGKRIFEGDIVEDGLVKGVVKFLEGTFDSGIYRYNGWVVECQGCVDHRALSDAGEEWEKPVVLGNIYDNPELLEVTPDE